MSDEPVQAAAPTRYSGAAVFLHWTLALLLAFQLGLGWRLDELPKGAIQFTAFQFHKSVGILILLLSLARLAIRLVRPRPAPVPDSAAAMLLAKAVHWLLYLVMIGGPLAGWVLISTSKVRMQTMVFGAVPWPTLPLGRAWHEPAETVHSALAWLLVGLVVLHVAGALRHHFARQDLLGRMLPRLVGLAGRPLIGAGLGIAGLALAYAGSQAWPFGSAAPVDQVTEAAPQPGDSAPSASPSPETAPSAEPSPSESAEAATKAAVPWTIQPGGRLAFRAAYSGAPVDGTFKRWNGDVLFSPGDLAHSRIRITVDLASVDSADSSRDDMLRSDSFFDVAGHPRAVFTATRFTAKGPGHYMAAGTLSLHGEQRPLALAFDLKIAGDVATAQGSARLDRLSWGVGSGEWATTDPIPDAVTVSFRLKALRARP